MSGIKCENQYPKRSSSHIKVSNVNNIGKWYALHNEIVIHIIEQIHVKQIAITLTLYDPGGGGL